MSKQDIREYTDSELSLLVFNDESLYKQRHRSDFINVIDELFIYRTEQLEELKNDLAEDLTEE